MALPQFYRNRNYCSIPADHPSLLPRPANASASFTIMLTDPPTVPAGTTVLNPELILAFQLHVTYPNGTIEWLPVSSNLEL